MYSNAIYITIYTYLPLTRAIGLKKHADIRFKECCMVKRFCFIDRVTLPPTGELREIKDIRPVQCSLKKIKSDFVL